MELFCVICIVFLSIITAVYVFSKYSFSYWQNSCIPFDKPTFPYGSIKGLGKTVHMSELTKKIYDKYKPTGAKMCGVYFFFRPVLMVLDLDLIKCIFVKEFANFNERNAYYNEVDDPLSAHLVSLDGEKWRKLRTKLTPAFTSGKMKFMFPTVVEVGERFRDCLFEIVKQHDELEVKELLARFTTDVIGTCAFGIECNSLKDPNAEFRHYGRKVFDAPRHSTLFLTILNGFKNIGRKLHVKTVRDDISAFFLNVVRDTVEYREKNNITRNDFMDLLIKLKNKGTDKEKSITFNELAAQAFVFFLAGFETTSSTLAFCLYELALNTDIQIKARRMIQEAYEKNDGQLTYEMMLSMPYIDQIIEETLRMYSPAAFLTRQTLNDFHVPGSDVVIERGTTILIPVHAIHRDPEHHQNPETFDPDRFGSDNKQKLDAMSWLAFGSGPRNCIGLRFGMMQARIGLITLLRSFEISVGPSTDIPVKFYKKIFLSTPDKVYLKFKPVKSQF